MHLAFLMGLVMFGVVAFLITPEAPFSIETTDVFVYIAPLLAISGVLVGNLIYQKKLQELLLKDSLREKMTGHQTANIIKYAFIEGPALFAIISYLQSGNKYFLIIAACLIAWFFLQRPSREKTENELQLQGEHRRLFNKVDEAVG